MSLRDLIRGPAPRKAAAAISATVAKNCALPMPTRAGIATVTVVDQLDLITPPLTVASIASVAVASRSRAEANCLPWKAADWRAFYDERAGILEYDGGVTRPEAEARAYEATIVEWMNHHHPRSEPGWCHACGADRAGEPLLPYGTTGTGHTWLHVRCWPSWYARRKAEAALSLKLLGIKTEASS